MQAPLEPGTRSLFLGIKVGPSQMERLDHLVKVKSRRRSELVRAAIDDYLAREETAAAS